MTKLFYIANIRMPTERAHGIQVAHMCAAFARAGAEVTLLVPDRKTIVEDPFEYYGVEQNFTIEKIPVPDTVRFGRLGFLLESLVFAFRAAKRVPPDAVVYTREELPLIFVSFGVKAFYEAHTLRNGLFFHRLVRRASGIVAISKGAASALMTLPFPREKILVAPDGYDARQFDAPIGKEEARKKLGLPVTAKVAMYIGGLDRWKGVTTLLEASKTLDAQGIRVAIIGGSERELSPLRARYPCVFFLGMRPYREMPANQQAADVLVLPNSATERISREFTSPLKLFAYMASGVPIVASDIPSIREILSEDECLFFEPDSPQSLSVAIHNTLSMATHRASVARAQVAMAKANAYTWEKRADRILSKLLTRHDLSG